MMIIVSWCLILLTACNGTETVQKSGIIESETTMAAYDLGELPLTEIDLKVDSAMPEPLPDSQNTGDDRLRNYYQPCKNKLDCLPVELMRLVDADDVDTWIANNSDLDVAHSKLGEYVNIYSFINTFNIPYNQTCEALKVYLEADDLPEEASIAQEDIDMLYSGNEAAIAAHFASDYSIVIGENVYSPQWVYLHTIEDYENVGITNEMISAKIEHYSWIPLSGNARHAFEEKLGSFLGETVKFDSTVIDQYFGGVSYDFDGYGLTIGDETIDVEWLSTHTIQEYREKGITAEMLEQFLSQISEYSDSREYDWINSCLIRMRE